MCNWTPHVQGLVMNSTRNVFMVTAFVVWFSFDPQSNLKCPEGSFTIMFAHFEVCFEVIKWSSNDTQTAFALLITIMFAHVEVCFEVLKQNLKWSSNAQSVVFARIFANYVFSRSCSQQILKRSSNAFAPRRVSLWAILRNRDSGLI